MAQRKWRYTDKENGWCSAKMSMMQEEKLMEIITLLEEKGYDSVAQLTGYIEFGNEDYITRHGGAREKIKAIDKHIIKEYLKTQKL